MLKLNLQTFSENPEDNKPNLSAENVTAFLTENVDYLKSFLGTDLGKTVVQSEVDRSVSKGIESWKANNLEKELQAKIDVLYPNETPEARKLKEMQSQIENIQRDKQRAEMANVTTNLLVQENIPTTFAKFLQGNDEATTRANISDFKHEFITTLNGTVDSKFKQFGHQPLTQQTQQTEQVKDPSSMSYAERTALFRSNPNEYNRIFG